MAKSTTSKSSVKKETAKPAAKAKAAPKAKTAAPAPAPAAKVEAAPKAPAAVKAAAPAPAKSASPQKTISAQDRYHMIDEAAYYRAEKSGFQVDPHANWIAAEQEINELLAKQNIKVV